MVQNIKYSLLEKKKNLARIKPTFFSHWEKSKDGAFTNYFMGQWQKIGLFQNNQRNLCEFVRDIYVALLDKGFNFLTDDGGSFQIYHHIILHRLQ